jgi:hypothetical protein
MFFRELLQLGGYGVVGRCFISACISFADCKMRSICYTISFPYIPAVCGLSFSTFFRFSLSLDFS